MIECEFCGIADFNVRSFESTIIKFDACSNCVRKVDEKLEEIGNLFKLEARKVIKEMMKK